MFFLTQKKVLSTIWILHLVASAAQYYDFNKIRQYKAIIVLFNPHYNPMKYYYDFHFTNKEIEAQRG